MDGSKFYLNFIEKELLPYIYKNYRTNNYHIFIGHLLGGLLALNSYTDSQSIFDAYIAIDPSIWWNNTMIKNKVAKLYPISFNKKPYIATANQGAEKLIKNKHRHDYLYKLIKNKSNKPQNIKIKYFENETHRSIPLTAIYEGLKYINN